SRWRALDAHVRSARGADAQRAGGGAVDLRLGAAGSLDRAEVRRPHGDVDLGVDRAPRALVALEPDLERAVLHLGGDDGQHVVVGAHLDGLRADGDGGVDPGVNGDAVERSDVALLALLAAASPDG